MGTIQMLAATNRKSFGESIEGGHGHLADAALSCENPYQCLFNQAGGLMENGAQKSLVTVWSRRECLSVAQRLQMGKREERNKD